MDTKLAVMFALAFGASVFFWGRGLIRGNAGDLYAGAGTLAATCMITLYTAGHSGVFSFIGLLVGGFGLTSLVLSLFASDKCPLDRSSRIVIGLGCLLGGLFLQVIL